MTSDELQNKLESIKRRGIVYPDKLLKTRSILRNKSLEKKSEAYDIDHSHDAKSQVGSKSGYNIIVNKEYDYNNPDEYKTDIYMNRNNKIDFPDYSQ